MPLLTVLTQGNFLLQLVYVNVCCYRLLVFACL